MKKILAIGSVVAMMACNEVEKLDKQLYDSTESSVPLTKIDQLNEIDKQDAAADSSAAKKDTVQHH